MQLPLFDAPPSVMSVSALNAYIKTRLEKDVVLRDLWLEGETSNWRPHGSGHIYFTLKDEEAQIRCVIWRTEAQQMHYLPAGDGEAVLAHGRVSVYSARGEYQLIVDSIEPVGVGALQARFEALKRSLAAEGLFEPERKKPLPPMPRRIGIVTSPGAAAFRDALNVIRRRYPLAEVILSPTQVQGADAPPQIVRALRALDESGLVDVILLIRGGGSLEDLWAFNDEALARAIADAETPIVSGIGHEIDFTIADFVADVRAPTPSAAAELATPDGEEIRRSLTAVMRYLPDLALESIRRKEQSLDRATWAMERLSPGARIEARRAQLDAMVGSMRERVLYRLAIAGREVEHARARLSALSPQATLRRGYAIVRRAGDGGIVTRAGDAPPGTPLDIEVSDGRIYATVDRP